MLDSASLPSAGCALTSSSRAAPCLQPRGLIFWAALVLLGHLHFDRCEPGSRGISLCTPQATSYARHQAQTWGSAVLGSPRLAALDRDHSCEDQGMRKGRWTRHGQSNPERWGSLQRLLRMTIRQLDPTEFSQKPSTHVSSGSVQ